MHRNVTAAGGYLAAGILGVGLVAAAVFGPVTVGLGLIGAIGAMVFSRQAGIFLLGALVVLAPTFNPAVVGSDDSGRLYATSVLIVLIVAAAIGSLLLTRQSWPKAVGPTVVCLALYVALLYRSGGQVPDEQLALGEFDGTLSWLYRPLQPIVLALAVTILLRSRIEAAKRILRLAIIVGGIGAALGFLNGAVPAFDPFALARPDNLPFRGSLEAAGGTYLRAAGAFVYPNVFGLFCAFLVICAFGALMHGIIGTWTARAVTAAALLGLLTSGARADLGGLVCAGLYLAWMHDSQRRLGRILGAAMALVVLTIALAQTTVGAAVVSGRISSITGFSGDARLYNTKAGWRIFSEVPVIGTGVRISRLDNGILLYLSMGGIIGFLLLCAAFYYVSRSERLKGGWKAIPLPSQALLIVVVTSSLLQDSLGQTLSSYFLGLGLGVFALLGPLPGRDAPEASEARIRASAS